MVYKRGFARGIDRFFAKRLRGWTHFGGGGVEAKFDSDAGLHYVEDMDRRVYVSDKKRLALYRGGIQRRQEWILRDYCLPVNLIRPGDVVIDVGANIGEIGIWVEQNQSDYIAFEPDPMAFKALQRNLRSAKLFDVALSDHDGTSKFFLATADADSSLFQPDGQHESVTVRTERLDSRLAELGRPERVRLLKIEAEGFEPEILSGSQETLERVEYLAVDAGPERGGENTVPGVLNALAGTDFEVISCFLERGTFLFRRRAFPAG